MSNLSDWAKSVKERDGECLECGRKEDLHAHHIKPKSAFPELIYDLLNGKTLCYRCHKLEHERTRHIRIRSKKPNRNTLLKRIHELEQQVEELSRFRQDYLSISSMYSELVYRLRKSGSEDKDTSCRVIMNTLK